MSRNDVTPEKPVPLVKGDTIGIVAPAGCFEMENFQNGITILEEMGFQTYIPAGLFEKDSYFAGPDAHRADILHRLFSDTTVKAIICARGGFGSVRLLSQLNMELIRNNPKIFIGFSDITVLLNMIFSNCGIVTFHGPMVTTLGNSDEISKEAMVSAITSARIIEIFPERGVVIKKGRASGTISGGNLSTLCHLVGTPYQLNFKDHILFLEDVNEAPYKIERMLFQMKLSGCLEGLSGLVIGSFENCGGIDDIHMVVDKIFKEDDIPILSGFEIGHGTKNMTIPLGIRATLDADLQKLVFHEPAVSK